MNQPVFTYSCIIHFLNICRTCIDSRWTTQWVHKRLSVNKSLECFWLTIRYAQWFCAQFAFGQNHLLSPCSGAGWRSLDSADALDIQARAAQGDFWLEESEFLSRFDDVTVGYPISEEGHLQSIYTGNSLVQYMVPICTLQGVSWLVVVFFFPPNDLPVIVFWFIMYVQHNVHT